MDDIAHVHSSIYSKISESLIFCDKEYRQLHDVLSKLDLEESFKRHMAVPHRLELMRDYAVFSLGEFMRIHREDAISPFPEDILVLSVKYLHEASNTIGLDDKSQDVLVDFVQIEDDLLLRAQIESFPMVVESSVMKERVSAAGVYNLLAGHCAFVHGTLKDFNKVAVYMRLIHSFVTEYDIGHESLADMNTLLSYVLFDLNRFNESIHKLAKFDLKCSEESCAGAFISGYRILEVLLSERPDLICGNERMFSWFVRTYKKTVGPFLKEPILVPENDLPFATCLVSVLSNLQQYFSLNVPEQRMNPALSVTIDGFEELFAERVRNLTGEVLDQFNQFRALHFAFESQVASLIQ